MSISLSVSACICLVTLYQRWHQVLKNIARLSVLKPKLTILEGHPKNEDIIKIKDDPSNIDELTNEDDSKNEEDHKIEDDLKNEDDPLKEDGPQN